MRGARVVTSVLTLGALALVSTDAEAATCTPNPCAPGCTQSCYISSNYSAPASGVPVHWKAMPIQYKINASRITAGLDKAKVIAAVQNAFKAWEGLACSTLKFQYAGESTSFSVENGMILVFWDTDPAYTGGTGTWTHGTYAYYTNVNWSVVATGEITNATIELNATPKINQYTYNWSVDPDPAKFHVESIVKWLVAPVVGLYVGDNPAAFTIPLMYGAYPALCQAHKTAAASTYNAGGSCTKPSLAYCGAGPISDASIAKEGSSTDASPAGEGNHKDRSVGPGSDNSGVLPDGGLEVGPGQEGYVPPAEAGVNNEAGLGTEGGGVPPEDEGCCRVGYGPSTRGGLCGLGLLGLLVLLGRRRRP